MERSPSAQLDRKSVIPPEMPQEYLTLEMDPVTKNIHIDHDPLKRFIKKLMVYMRESQSKTFAEMKYSVGQELIETKHAMRLTLDERCREIEAKLMSDPRVLQLQADVAALKEGVDELDAEHSRISVTLGRVESEIIKQSNLDINDLSDIRRIVQEFHDDNVRAKNMISDSVGRLDCDVEVLHQKLEDAQEALQKQAMILERRLGQEVSRLQDDLGEANELLEKLSVAKADVTTVKELTTEVRAFGALAEKGAEAADLVPRVSGLERTRRTFDGLLEKTQQGIEALEKARSDLQQRLENCFSTLENVEQRGQASMVDRFGQLAEANSFMARRVSAVETATSGLMSKLASLENKADVSDVTALRAVLGGITQDLKDKEEAVLFGARCLGCNRVYDDVQREADVVDLSLERQKGHVFAEIQRALQTPRCDPLETLGLLTVKVGRPAALRAKGMPPFAGRDPDGIQRGLEDIHLSPLKPGRRPSPPQSARAPPRKVVPLDPRAGGPMLSPALTGSDWHSRPTTSQSMGGPWRGRHAGCATPAKVTPAALMRQDNDLDFRYGLKDLLRHGGDLDDPRNRSTSQDGLTSGSSP